MVASSRRNEGGDWEETIPSDAANIIPLAPGPHQGRVLTLTLRRGVTGRSSAWPQARGHRHSQRDIAVLFRWIFHPFRFEILERRDQLAARLARLDDLVEEP